MIQLSNKTKRVALKSAVVLTLATNLAPCVIQPLVVYAGVTKLEPIHPDDKPEKSVSPWYTWQQSAKPWADDRSGNGAYSIQEAGCWVVSSAMLMAMAGLEKTADGRNITPHTVNDYMMKNGGFLGEGFIHNAPNSVSGGKFNLLESTFNQSFDDVVKRVNGGEYAMIFNGWHMVAVYRATNDKIFIMDPESAQFSGGKPRMEYVDRNYKMYAEENNQFLYDHPFAQVLYFKADKPSTESLTVDSEWSQADPSGGSSVGRVEKTTEGKKGTGSGGGWMPSEDFIPNMPKDRNYVETGRGASEWNNYIREWQRKQNDDFKEGTEGYQSVAKWKEERQQEVESRSIQSMRRGFTLAGIALSVLSGAFFIIYIWDRWNPFGIYLVQLLTRGRVKVIDGTKESASVASTSKSVRILTDYNVFGFMAIMSLVSVFMLSGTMYAIFAWFVEKIMQALGYLNL